MSKQANQAVNLKSVKLSKNQLAEVAKRAQHQLAEALRSVAVAGTADGVCMLALHGLRMHNIPCAPALHMAIESLGAEGNKDVLKTRKMRLKAVAEAVDANVSVLYKGVKTTVGSLLAKVNVETGKTKPGSLQGLYGLLRPTPAKTEQAHRDWVNEQVLQLMQRDAAKGGGLWVLETSNATYLKSEYNKALAEAKAKADAKVASKKAA